jgi:hypothetical protein
MSPLRCPVCKAENATPVLTQPGSPEICRRCKADLSLLFRLEAQRRHLLAEARRLAAAGLWSAFLAAVLQADRLRSDAETQQLRAVGRLLAGDFARALTEARTVHEHGPDQT